MRSVVLFSCLLLVAGCSRDTFSDSHGRYEVRDSGFLINPREYREISIEVLPDIVYTDRIARESFIQGVKASLLERGYTIKQRSDCVLQLQLNYALKTRQGRVNGMKYTYTISGTVTIVHEGEQLYTARVEGVRITADSSVYGRFAFATGQACVANFAHPFAVYKVSDYRRNTATGEIRERTVYYED